MDRPIMSLTPEEAADVARSKLREALETGSLGSDAATRRAAELLQDAGFDLTNAHVNVDVLGKHAVANIPNGPGGEPIEVQYDGNVA